MSEKCPDCGVEIRWSDPPHPMMVEVAEARVHDGWACLHRQLAQAKAESNHLRGIVEAIENEAMSAVHWHVNPGMKVARNPWLSLNAAKRLLQYTTRKAAKENT